MTVHFVHLAGLQVGDIPHRYNVVDLVSVFFGDLKLLGGIDFLGIFVGNPTGSLLRLAWRCWRQLPGPWVCKTMPADCESRGANGPFPRPSYLRRHKGMS